MSYFTDSQLFWMAEIFSYILRQTMGTKTGNISKQLEIVIERS
jgi:hypothetical protein